MASRNFFKYLSLNSFRDAKLKNISQISRCCTTLGANGNFKIQSSKYEIGNDQSNKRQFKIEERRLSTQSADGLLAAQSDETKREVKHHSKYADDWWDMNGIMRPLHALNSIRVPFIRDGLVARGNVNHELIRTTRVLSNQKVLEVGCGGGILTEQLARLGAHVTGIDLSEALIEAARCHLKEKSKELIPRIEYKIEPIEVHAVNNCDHYDAVVLSEVLEHVDDKIKILDACVKALKPNGSLFITTLNQTVLMWVGGVLIGEYVLNLAPKGTHHWDKMISPLDCQRILDTLNCQTVLINGSTYDFWSNTWRWVNNTNFCYALQAIKVPSN